LCFLLFSALSFLVIGFFFVAPVLNAITTFVLSEFGIKFLRALGLTRVLLPVSSLSQRCFFRVSMFFDFSFFSRSVPFSPAFSWIDSKKSSFPESNSNNKQGL
jgi:hypothetical protein